jgi:hypothetical protein
LSRVIVFGGYGVFGSHVASALSAWGIPLSIAGRDLRQAQAWARTLGGDCRACPADVTLPDSCRDALQGHTVAVDCTGPFYRQQATLLQACLQSGCHYADIADDRGYAALVRSFDGQFVKRGLAAVWGCSSLPGISGALALLARETTTANVVRARVTLFIGNKNPKGRAAIGSLLTGLGMPIRAPQGALLGFHDREVVSLPQPFGRRGVFNFQSPEYDLFPSLLGSQAVTVKVGFELRSATYALALLARLHPGYGARMARILELAARPSGRLGSSGGAVMSELFLADGSVHRAALVAHRDGQRMAALPCAFVARALHDGTVQRPGAATAYEFLGARPLIENLVNAGFQLHTAP